MDKDEYAKIKSHDQGTRQVRIFSLLFLEIVALTIGLLEVIIWKNYFFAALCFFNAIVFLFVIPRNLTIWLDFRFYGKTKDYERFPFVKHSLVLLGIELCVFGASLPFLNTAYFVFIALSMSVILALIMLLIIEKHTFSEIHKFLDMDKVILEKM